jgi:hypothetical protein
LFSGKFSSLAFRFERKPLAVYANTKVSAAFSAGCFPINPITLKIYLLAVKPGRDVPLQLLLLAPAMYFA